LKREILLGIEIPDEATEIEMMKC